MTRKRLAATLAALGVAAVVTATAAGLASAKSNAAAPGDVLTMMAGRSVSASFTVGLR